MSGEVRYLEFAEGVAVTTSTTPIFVNASSFGVYANDAAFVTAKGSVAAQGDAYLNSTDGKIHYYNTLWEVVEAAKNNLTATSAPTVNDDFSSDNYTVGSKWCDTTNDKIYIAIDVSTGAAIWLEVVTANTTQTITGVKTFSGITTISNTTTSTTKDTGALVVEGGVGIEENLNVGGNVVVTGDLTVNGTNTILNTTTLEVEDANIIINNGGSKASADNIAGITVEMSDNTHGSIKYQSTLTSRFKVGDAGSEVEIATVSGAQAITNKDIDGGTASNASRITVPKNTRTNLEGLTRKEGTIVYDTDSDVFLGDNGSALAAFGGGGGEYNFLSSKLISNFSTYDDGDVAIPVDGTGGTASYITVAASPSPITNETGVLNLRISKANGGSARGEGVSVPFATRGPVDRSAMRVVKINITSSANYIDGAFGVYLYDVTNSRLIYPADQNISASSFVSQQQFSFQMSPNSDSYRAILHCQDATVTTAYDLDMTMKIVENKVSSGAMNIDWKSPTVESYIKYGTTTATNVTSYATKYKRAGDSLDLNCKILFSGAANAVGVIYFYLPNGLSIDSDKLSSTTPHVQLAEFKTNSKYYSARITYAGSNAFLFERIDDAGTTGAAWTGSTTAANNIPGAAAIVSGDYMLIELKDIPISGWSSNQVLSEDAGNRGMIANIYLNTATNHTSSGSALKVPLETVVQDTTASWDAVNKRLVIPENSSYHISFSSAMNGIADTKWMEALLYINGVNVSFGSLSSNGGAVACVSQGSITLSLKKNDYVELYTTQNNSASTAYVTGADATYLTIFKIPSPQQIAQSEKVYAAYNTNTATSIANAGAQIVPFEDKIVDSHNAYNTSTGVYTCPRSGILNLSTVAQLASNAGWAAGEQAYISVTILTTEIVLQNRYMQASLTYTMDLSGSLIAYPVKKGDTLAIKVYQGSGGAINLSGLAAFNHFELMIV